MYKVAICDDEKTTCTELEKTLQNHNMTDTKLLSEEFEVESFFGGEQLIEKLKTGVHYDFIFLDIHLTAMNGVDVGKWMREELHDYKTFIIYISSDVSYAMELFQVQPFDFLVKPLKQEQIYRVIDKGICRLKASIRFLEYQKNKSVYKVNCDDILYLYSNRKMINVVKANGEGEEFYGKLKDVLAKLPNNFLMINQSYVVNHNYVQHYSYEEVVMVNKQTFLISRAHRKEVREMLQQNR